MQENEHSQNLESLIKSDSVLFFDMDGTLVDTNFANFLAYKKAVVSVTGSDFNLSFNLEQRFNRTILKSSVPGLSENIYEKIIQEKEQYYGEFLSETILKNDVAQILFKYSKTHRTVLVTNCRKDRALTTLNHFGLTDHFNNFFFRQFSEGEVTINKFQNAISSLNISADSVIAFENEDVEIADALKAGIRIINPNYIR